MIVECEYCHNKVTNLQIVQVLERKRGKLTGKKYLLCPSCYKRFSNFEVSFLDLDKEKKQELKLWIERKIGIN